MNLLRLGPKVSLLRQLSSVAASQPTASIKLTDSCLQQLAKVIPTENDGFLRIEVDGGGCSGFQYKFKIDTTLQPEDKIFAKRVVIDVESLELCAGATLDYQEELMRSGFRMLANPRADTGCSCGASFSLIK